MPVPAARVVVLTMLLAGPAAGQTAKDTLATFAAERAAAVALKYPPDALAAADKVAAKAAAALTAGDEKAAARAARDARWLLPARPAGLPDHVGLVFGATRLKHADRVNGLAYSPDGTRLASASRDGTVRIWDLANGRELLSYRGHPAPQPVAPDKPLDEISALRVGGVAWSPDGKLVASAGWQDVHLWDPATGKLAVTLKKHTKLVKAIAFDPAGKRLVTGGDDRLVVVWDVATGKEVFAAPPQNSRIEAVAFGPNGTFAAAADLEGFLTYYDTTAAKPAGTRTQATEVNGAGLTTVAFSPDGAKVLTGGADKIAKLVAGPAPKTTVPPTSAPLVRFVGHTDMMTAAAFTPDAKFVVSAGNDRTVRVFDAVSGKQIRLFQGHLGFVSALAVRPDGRQAASGADDGTIRLWDLNTTDDHTASPKAAEMVWAAGFGPGGTTYAFGGADRIVRICDARGAVLHTLKGHAGSITAIAYLGPDRIATAAGDKVIKLWDVKTGALVKDLPGHTSAVLSLAATADGKTLLSASADKTVKAWDAAAGTVKWTWDAKSVAVTVAVTADGTKVAVGSADGTLTILVGGKPLGGVAAHAAGVAAVAFDPSGETIATAGGDGLVKLWAVKPAGPPVVRTRIESAARTGTTNATAALSAVAFDPAGKRVAAGGADAVVRVFDAGTGAELRGLRGHTDWVTAVMFSPDGDKLLSAGVDKVVRVFDLGGTGGAAAAGGHAQAVRAVAVSRDGKLVATASDDKTVKIWDRATGREVASLGGMSDKTYALAFVGPDRVAAGGQDNRLRIWAVPGGKEIAAVPAGVIYGIVAAADGNLSVWSRNTGGEDEFSTFTPDGKLVGTSHVEKGVGGVCAALAADGRRVMVGYKEGEFRLIDFAQKKAAAAAWPITSPVLAGDVGLSADGATVFSLDSTGELKVGDVAKGEVTATAKAVTPAADGTVALTVAPAGDRAAAVGGDGEVKVFDRAAKLVRGWKLPGPANAAAFAPDGKSLFVGNADGTLYVLELP